MSRKYIEYLQGHTSAVAKAAFWMADNIELGVSEDEAEEFLKNALVHDISKFGAEEFAPYDGYFYGEKDEAAFNAAWLHHIHDNQHHWQHWMLMNDDGKYRDPGKVAALPMPRIHALEMVADWWSFSWRSGNLYEVFDWYGEHKDGMALHHSTREYVEDVMGRIRKALDDATFDEPSTEL